MHHKIIFRQLFSTPALFASARRVREFRKAGSLSHCTLLIGFLLLALCLCTKSAFSSDGKKPGLFFAESSAGLLDVTVFVPNEYGVGWTWSLYLDAANKDGEIACENIAELGTLKTIPTTVKASDDHSAYLVLYTPDGVAKTVTQVMWNADEERWKGTVLPIISMFFAALLGFISSAMLAHIQQGRSAKQALIQQDRSAAIELLKDQERERLKKAQSVDVSIVKLLCYAHALEVMWDRIPQDRQEQEELVLKHEETVAIIDLIGESDTVTNVISNLQGVCQAWRNGHDANINRDEMDELSNKLSEWRGCLKL